MREIEQALQKIPTRIIEHATIASILHELGYSRINDKIVHLIKHNILVQIKRGLYVYVPLNNKILLSIELIGNTLLSPSYISLDYALSYHNIIPEKVWEITSVTTKRSKDFQTPYGVFSFKQIKKELFSIGLQVEHSQNATYMIATKEKALCDKVFFATDIHLRSKSAMLEFLENDLRVDLDEFREANLEIFDNYFKISKSYKIGILAKIMQGVKNEYC